MPEVQSQQLKDGTWSFTCELSMDECVRRIQENCASQRFRILDGSSETRLRDAPPFEHAYHTSRLHLVCTNDGDSPLVTLGGDKKAPEKAAPDAGKKCGAGETRACVGPGACKGGQACLADGKGFGACDCGPVASAPAPAPTATSSGDTGDASVPAPPSSSPQAPPKL